MNELIEFVSESWLKLPLDIVVVAPDPKAPPSPSSNDKSWQGHASQSGYDNIGNAIRLNGFSFEIGFMADFLQSSFFFFTDIAAIIKQIPYITTFIIHIIIFIIIRTIGYKNAKTCNTIINVTNAGVNNVINILNKKNKKSKFFTPSLTGNLFVVVVHPLSVISLIPKCLLRLNPHFHLSTKLAIV